jgi:hypothetical protein
MDCRLLLSGLAPAPIAFYVPNSSETEDCEELRQIAELKAEDARADSKSKEEDRS